MSFLPAPLDDGSDGGLTPRQLSKAQRAQASAELEIHQHFLWTRALAEKERLDAQAAGDALRASLDEELRLLREGLALAGQSAAGVELVARKVELLAAVDNRRFSRRFGG
jgi:hypothetical protein